MKVYGKQVVDSKQVELEFFKAQTNVSAKFTGCGGNCSSLAVKKQKKQEKAPVSNIFRATPVNQRETTLFKMHYDRGDLPICVEFSGAQRKIKWKMEPELLDYSLYLPVFFDGIREVDEPYKFLADKGCDQLLERGSSKILSVLPKIVLPIKKGLEVKDNDVMCIMLRKVQKLVLSGDMIGEALVPYYRQILPVFNLFKNKNKNIGDKIEYSQRKLENVGDLIQQTLEIFEQKGGEDAYINIKFMVPCYESCIF